MRQGLTIESQKYCDICTAASLRLREKTITAIVWPTCSKNVKSYHSISVPSDDEKNYFPIPFVEADMSGFFSPDGYPEIEISAW
jgi:hypothetical protein